MIKALFAKLFPIMLMVGLIYWAVTAPRSLANTATSLGSTGVAFAGETLRTFGEWLAEQTGGGR